MITFASSKPQSGRKNVARNRVAYFYASTYELCFSSTASGLWKHPEGFYTLRALTARSAAIFMSKNLKVMNGNRSQVNGDVARMTSLQFPRPTFCLPNDRGPVRVIGLLVLYGPEYSYNPEPFETFPITETGCILFDMPARYGGASLFQNPVKKGSKFYTNLLMRSINANEIASEDEFLECCKEIGLEIVE